MWAIDGLCWYPTPARTERPYVDQQKGRCARICLKHFETFRNLPKLLETYFFSFGFGTKSLRLRARFLIQIGVPTNLNASRIWFSRKR